MPCTGTKIRWNEHAVEFAQHHDKALDDGIIQI